MNTRGRVHAAHAIGRDGVAIRPGSAIVRSVRGEADGAPTMMLFPVSGDASTAFRRDRKRREGRNRTQYASNPPIGGHRAGQRI